MDNPVDKNPVLHFLNFNNRKLPKFIEVKNKDYVSYGDKNDYGYYLNDLYRRSSYHCAIINGKVNYIAGGGWTYDKKGVVTVSQKAQAEKIISQPFADTDLNETTRRITMDFEIFNGFAILVTWSKNKKTAVLEHIDFCNLRTNADKTEFYYTRNWYKNRNGGRYENKTPEREEDWVVYDAYDPENRNGKQIYYYCSYAPDQYVYPLPTYIGAITWIENHIIYSDFQYTNISSSFSPSQIVNIYGNVPPIDKQEEITNGIRDNFTGAEGKRVIVAFHQSRELGTEAKATDIPDQSLLYKTIAEQSLENIFVSHSVVSPMLFGIRTEGQLGGRNEIITAEETFIQQYVVHRQRCLEYAINEIANDIAIGINFKLKKVKSVEWMPDDNTISRVIGDRDLSNYVRERLAFDLTTKQSFSSNERKQAKLDVFMKYGCDADKFEIISARDIPTTDPIKLEKFEQDYLRMEFAEIKIKSVDRAVLDLLSKDGFMSIDEMASVIKVTPKEVKQAIARLVDKKLIKPSYDSIAGDKVKNYTVSENALASLDEKPAKTSGFTVKYRYDLATDAPKLIAGGKSRPFCSDLMAMNKIYTRDEINLMSDEEDRNVWELRGGWYHNPNTDVNEPMCRHTWRQLIVKEK